MLTVAVKSIMFTVMMLKGTKSFCQQTVSTPGQLPHLLSRNACYCSKAM